MKLLLVLRLVVLVAVSAAVMMATQARAQEEEAGATELQVTGQDIAAATTLTSNIRYHLLLARTAAAKTVSPDFPPPKFPQRSKPRLSNTTLPSPPPGSFFYPDDVEKVSSTGVTITTAMSHPIYVNCLPSCWATPTTFLTDLGKSTFIHLLDQYTGSVANLRYTVGTTMSVTTTIYPGTSGVPTLSENSILGFVHAAAKLHGTGYGHIYHVFLPKGVDHCMDEGPCYSPDNFGIFAFCAYHFTVKFADIGNVYYTVEPFQQVVGCELPTGTPNGQLADSTYNVLSHELFESISDPDISTGYRAVNSSFGEIGDLCEGFFFIFPLNAKMYAVQAEYSDTYEACATTP